MSYNIIDPAFDWPSCMTRDEQKERGTGSASLDHTSILRVRDTLVSFPIDFHQEIWSRSMQVSIRLYRWSFQYDEADRLSLLDYGESSTPLYYLLTPCRIRYVSPTFIY